MALSRYSLVGRLAKISLYIQLQILYNTYQTKWLKIPNRECGALNNDLHKLGRIPKSPAPMSTSFIFSTVCYRCSTFVESPLQIRPLLCKTNPISQTPRINATLFYTKGYDNQTPFGLHQNEPKQTQNEPKQSQFPYARQNEHNFASHKGL